MTNFLVKCLCLLVFIPLSVLAEESISDPLEPVNRGVFWFNEQLDYAVLEPVAEGYDSVFPEFVKDGVSNFYENLGFPKYFISDLIQLKFGQALHHTGRFLVNTTVGVGGLIDVAREIGLEEHREDFGTALAYHGVGPGPYLVLPIIGPSNIRDGIGRLVDSFLDPLSWIAFTKAAEHDAWFIVLGSKSLDVVDTRASLIEGINAAREASLDFYLFTQSAYYQYRDALVCDRKAEQIPSDALEGADDQDVDAWLDEGDELE